MYVHRPIFRYYIQYLEIHSDSTSLGIIFVFAPSIHIDTQHNTPKRYKDTTLHNINNTMSREERRANDEREIKLACDELQDFGAMYRSPDDGETPERRRSRKQTIKRSIAAAKKRRGITTKRKKNFGEIVSALGYPTTIPTTVKMMRQEERGSVRSS